MSNIKIKLEIKDINHVVSAHDKYGTQKIWFVSTRNPKGRYDYEELDIKTQKLVTLLFKNYKKIGVIFCPIL